MNWFIIALCAPVLWAIVNIADTFLVVNFSLRDRERSSGGLVLFSSLIGVFVAFGIYICVPGVNMISSTDKILLLFTGVLTIVWIIFYLFALELEEVSSVVPWFLATPVFGYILGYFILDENLNQNQILGSVVILLGLFILSINWHEKVRHIKHKPVLYMIIASICVAFSGIIFKYVTIEGDYWVSSFWEYLGLGSAGLLIYIFIPKYRREFHYMNSKGGKKIFLINILSELMGISGNLLTNFALLLAPVTLVFLVSTFQSIFVLCLTILGTYFFPRIVKENLSSHALIPKIIAISITILGSVILFW